MQTEQSAVCTRCTRNVVWSREHNRWQDKGPFGQYCWIDPQLGSELHTAPLPAYAIVEDEVSKLRRALSDIKEYPTGCTDAAVLGMKQIAEHALK